MNANNVTRWASVWVATAVLGLVLAACGGAASEGPAPEPAGAPRPLAAAPEPVPQEPAGSEPADEAARAAPAERPTPERALEGTTPATPPAEPEPAPAVPTAPEPARRPAPAIDEAPTGPAIAEQPVDELRSAVAAAAAATTEAGSAEVSGVASSDGGTVTFDGQIEIGPRAFAGELSFDGDAPITTIVLGDVAYLQDPDLPFGATWEELVPDGEFPALSTTLDMPFGFLAVLGSIDPDGSLVDLGAADGGEPARHIELPIDAERLLEAAGLDAGWFGAWSGRQLSASAEVRIDEAGYLASVSLVVDAGFADEEPFTVVTELSGVGVPVEISKPADDDIARDEDFGIPFAQLEPGDCFTEPSASTTGYVYGVLTADCDQPHQGEVYATVQLGSPGDPYPGEDAAWDMTAEICTVEFEAYVGEPYATSELDFWAVYPGEPQWLAGDRLVVCSVVRTDLGTLDDTVQAGQM